MTDDFLGLLNVLLSLIIFFVCSIFFYKKLITRDFVFVFWGGLLYFCAVPVLIDSFLIFFGGLESLNSIILEDTPSYWDGVNNEILLKINTFTFGFAFVFIFFDTIFKKIFRVEYRKSYDYNYIQLIILFLLAITPCVFLFQEGFNFISNQKEGLDISKTAKNSYILLPIGAIVAYNLFNNKKYFLGLIFCIPILIISFLSQSRTLFILVPVALIMSYIFTAKIIEFKKILIYVILVLSLTQFVKIATNDDYGIYYTDNKTLFLVNKMIRDVSIGDAYYSFHIRDIDPNLTTEGSSSLALISVGVVPPFINRELFLPEKTATYKIYQLRYGDFDFGSIHPTLIGYAYFDLGFLGVFLAIFFAAIMRLYYYLMSKFSFSQAIAPVLLGGFIFVSLRGSINVAYFNLVYSGILIFLVLMLINGVKKTNIGKF